MTVERSVALVTGASRRAGIGAAICRELARAGHDIAFTHWQPFDATASWGVDEEGPSALAIELRAFGVRVLEMDADLADAATPPRLFDETERELGFPRILVNNAAHSTDDGYALLDAETIDAHYLVNFRGTALMSVEMARRWPGGDGRIINLTSGQGQGPMPDELAYGASKGAIEAFTRSLAAGIGHLGITVNAVNPGPTDTGWMTPELKEALLSKFALGRIGLPEDAARLIAFLASDAAGWITGQVINSEGGFLRG